MDIEPRDPPPDLNAIAEANSIAALAAKADAANAASAIANSTGVDQTTALEEAFHGKRGQLY